MRKSFLLLSLLPLLFCCSSDDDENVEKGGTSISLAGNHYTSNYDYSEFVGSWPIGDSEFQRMSNALNFCPRDKYDAKWNSADTTITLHEYKTTQLITYFQTDDAMTLTVYTKTESQHQRAKKYHHEYKFNGDYYNENSLYMTSVSSNIFTVYDKTTSMSYAFRLDGTYGYCFDFYMPQGKEDIHVEDNHTEIKCQYEYSDGFLTLTDNYGGKIYGRVVDGVGYKMLIMTYDGKDFALTMY